MEESENYVETSNETTSALSSTDVEFLEETARYFEKRDTHGEDKAFWANIYNAKNCRVIAEKIKAVIAPSLGDAA